MVKKYNQREQRDGRGFLSPSHLAVVFDSVFASVFLVFSSSLFVRLYGIWIGVRFGDESFI